MKEEREGDEVKLVCWLVKVEATMFGWCNLKSEEGMEKGRFTSDEYLKFPIQEFSF